MKKIATFFSLCVAASSLSATPVEYVISTSFEGAPAVLKISYDTDDLNQVPLTNDGVFSIENKKLPTSEVSLTDASTGKLLSQYRNVFIDWYRQPLVFGETDITDIRINKAFSDKSVTIEMTIETPHANPIYPWKVSNSYGHVTHMVGDFYNGPAGAFEREPTVLNPVTTSKP